MLSKLIYILYYYIFFLSITNFSGLQSEDDGQGGRRKKKGLREKIKEKLTLGKQKDEHPQTTGFSAATTTTTTTTATQHHDHEKKSMMEKIKEKLPGGHHSSSHSH